MPIPDRAQAGDFHFLAYSYPGDADAAPWDLSQPVPARGNYRFLSLRNALQGLHGAAQENGVPNVSLSLPGEAIHDGGNTFCVMALSFGGGDDPQREVLITGGVHAREWIAPTMAYLLAEYLIKHYAAEPEGQCQTAIHDLVNGTRIHFVPLLNPAGNWHSVFSLAGGARLWRKNRRRLPLTPDEWARALGLDLDAGTAANPPLRNIAAGADQVTYEAPLLPDRPGVRLRYDPLTIDLAPDKPQYIGVDVNRNFNTPFWGHESGADEEGLPPDQAYFGPNRVSEAETRSLVGFLRAQAVDAAIDYHSYGQYIIYAGEGRTPQLAEVDNGRALQSTISSRLNPRWWNGYDYSLGSVFGLLSYRASASVADYMAVEGNAIAFTIELSPSSSDGAGFQLPEDRIMATFEANIRGALGFIAAADRSRLRVIEGGLFTRHGIAATPYATFAGWNVFGRGNRLPA